MDDVNNLLREMDLLREIVKGEKSFVDQLPPVEEIDRAIQSLLFKLEVLRRARALQDDDIDVLSFSVRTRKCLRRANIDTLSQLCEQTVDSLIDLRNFGETGLREVQDKLRERGLRLKDH